MAEVDDAPPGLMDAPSPAKTPYDSMIALAADKYRVNPARIKAIIEQESNFNPTAYNEQTKAAGLGQFIPASAKAYNINPLDPGQSIDTTARMFRENQDRFGGDEDKATAAHFAGPNQKLWGPKTTQYQKDVNAKMAKYADEPPGLSDEPPGLTDAPGRTLAKGVVDQAALREDIKATSALALPEVAAHVASGAVAAPIGNLAGLGAMAAHYFGLTDKLPEDVKQQVQQALTYDPRTSAGKELMKPVEAVGKFIDKAAQKGADIIAPFSEDSPLNPINKGMKEALLQGANLLGLKGAAKAKAGAIAEQGALDIAKGANAVKDATRDAAMSAGYIPPPEGGIPALLGGMNKTKVEKKLSSLNEQNATMRLKADVGGLPDRALSTAEFENLKADAGKAYDAVKDAAGPTLRVTPEFEDSLRGSLAAVNAKLAYDAKTYEGLKPARDLIQSYLRKIAPPPAATRMKETPSVMQTIAAAAKEQPGSALARTIESAAADTPYHFGLPPAEAMPVPTPSAATLGTRQTIKAIQDLRGYAKDDFRLGNKDMGTARLGIANQLENLVEANLAQSGQAGLLDQFKAARQRFAKIYLLDRITEPSTGAVNLQKLASLSNTPAYKDVLTGEFKTAADFARAYGKATQKGAAGGISSSLSPFDLMFGVASIFHGSPKAAVTEIAGRLAIPMMAERGMLRTPTPSYQLGAARSVAPAALQAASIAATQRPRSPEEALARLIGGR